ncbi:MAG: 6-phosphogluconolactonase [Armatimonadetes bacterium]|nr:6-phosphogluconolactonase [Armatimonadota bacterium]
MSRRVRVFENLEELSRAALERLQGQLRSTSGPFRLSLAGGGTPRELYRMMAGADLPWDRLHLYWGDERYVPHDHPDSNYRMVCEALLDFVAVSPDRIHPWPYLHTPEDSAQAYDRLLQEARMDLVILGMGDDGHTASLFPGTSALEVRDRRAVAHYVEKLKTFRLTTTYPVINEAPLVMFLISGASKAPALEQVLTGRDLPSARVENVGETLFLVDRPAAARLPAELLPPA